MKLYTAAILLLFVGCDSTRQQEKPMVDRYVIISAGESNSGGYGNNADASAGEIASRSEIQMWNVNTDVFENLDIGTNNNLDHSGLSSTSHGWELQLANDVASGVWTSIQNPLYYIQTGQGGSTIANWGSGGAYWAEWLARVNAAKSYFSSNSITPKWIIFVSIGINDAIAGTATATFKTNLVTWLNLIKTECPSCKIVLTEVTPTYPTFSTAIREVADAETDVAFAYTQDLGLRDINHWSYAGLKTLSTRMSYLAQFMWGVADGKVFTNYTSTMHPKGQQFGWTGSSPATAGAIQKESMSWGDGSFVSWLTPSSAVSDAIVVAIESTKDTNHVWSAAQTYLYGAYRFNADIWGGVNYSGTASRGASSDEARIYRSGDDALLQVRTTGGSWTTRHTSTGAFSGVSSIWVHVINAASGATDTLTLSLQLNPTITITAPTSGTIALVGVAQAVTWSSTDVTGTVDILYSSDGGSNYSVIASGETNDNSYSWTPTSGQLSADARIRVRSTSSQSVYGTSSSIKVATTSGGGGSNTGLWFRLQELAVADGLELTRP
jgi:hypothetical protein